MGHGFIDDTSPLHSPFMIRYRVASTKIKNPSPDRVNTFEACEARKDGEWNRIISDGYKKRARKS